ncbi:MAG: helix-hairpin-helix domain-containing protein [Bacteroidetes bacterium]|nr:helix-hairpin-helix domain-containing protein [Bacteroidota bacterium]HET6245749.1 helix-hairpin-helix domain-containing protein [Bacteroidia bacterium]
MKLISIQIFLVLFLLPFFIIAQEKQVIIKESAIEQKIETIAENAEDTEVDYTLLFDELLYYIENPINLNKTNKEALNGLQMLTDFQINNLLEHIEKNGKLISIIELQAVKDFDLQTIRNIMPFVTVTSDLDRPRLTFKEMMNNGKHQLIARHHIVLEDQKGYTLIDDSTLAANPNSRYLGSKDKLYTRYRFNYGSKISWGFTAEKDPGEEFFKGTQKKGFDFFTAHLFIRDMGFVKAATVGDYQAQFGQGLTFWSGLAMGKSSFALNLKRQGQGLRPFGSVDENLFLRGAGVTLGHKNFEFTAFGSHKNIDANFQVNSDTTFIDNDAFIQEETIITSFQLSGFHRTPTEISRKNSISETIFGGHLAYKKRNLKIGTTAVRTEYGGLLQRNLSLYNQFDFNSSQNLNLGIDYNWIYYNMNFFGEVARSANGGFAMVNGVLMSIDPRLSLIILHRKYGKDYQAMHSMGVGEGSKNSNEQGIYTGIVFNPSQKVTITAYYDRFVFPWMRYLVDAPSYGTDYLVQINYTPSRKVDMYVRVRQRDKFKNSPEDIDEIDPVVGTNQINYRYHVSYSLTPSIKLRNRVDFIQFRIGDRPKENGYLIFQDLIYKPMKYPFSLNLRYALFDTDSYNSRIYTYESDVLYAFSIPGFSNRGSRAYAILQYTFKRNMDIWIRYAQTYYYNKNVIGSGLEEIQGNTRSELKVQLRYRF